MANFANAEVTSSQPQTKQQIFDNLEDVKQKVKVLANWLRQHKGSCIVHVGAGLSTSAGIPDFRGKKGVWTKLQNVTQKQRSSLENQIDFKKEDTKDDVVDVKPFDETGPTVSHLILKLLCDLNYVKHIVSQNVDGLFLKANLDRKYISELHGNFYLDECTKCRSRYIRKSASTTMRLQKSDIRCPRDDKEKPCSGHLRDTILDWESPIPFNELRCAEKESKRNKLHICIGTSLQLKPSKDLVCDPTIRKTYKLVVINLQPIQLNNKANLVINYYADDVMRLLADELDLGEPKYEPAEDPTKNSETIGKMWKKC